MCTVLLDGKPIYSCMTPAWKADGRKITTVEGISTAPDVLHPIQSAMIEKFAFQCGYCTGAMILVGKALLDSNPRPTEDDVRKAMSGVLCRCTNYERYIDAIIEASKASRQ